MVKPVSFDLRYIEARRSDGDGEALVRYAYERVRYALGESDITGLQSGVSTDALRDLERRVILEGDIDVDNPEHHLLFALRALAVLASMFEEQDAQED